jgi:hypothetical protein
MNCAKRSPAALRMPDVTHLVSMGFFSRDVR